MSAYSAANTIDAPPPGSLSLSRITKRISLAAKAAIRRQLRQRPSSHHPHARGARRQITESAATSLQRSLPITGEAGSLVTKAAFRHQPRQCPSSHHPHAGRAHCQIADSAFTS
jgi:hypothetical protein